MAVAEGPGVAAFRQRDLVRARRAVCGGADGRFGTNPVCIGIPLPGEPPFLLDMATSAVAQGKLRVAHNKGAKIPLGWLIDDQGNPTDDPRWGVAPLGAMQTSAGTRATASRWRASLLGGALTGGGDLALRRKHEAARAERHAVDRDRSGAPRHQRARSERDASSSTGCASRRAAPGADRVRIAGEPEREYAREARARRHPGRRRHLEGNPRRGGEAQARARSSAAREAERPARAARARIAGRSRTGGCGCRARRGGDVHVDVVDEHRVAGFRPYAWSACA